MPEKLSFTRNVKDELVNNEYESADRLRALLSAYIRINGSLVIRDRKTLLVLQSENAKISVFLYTHIKDIYGIKPNLVISNKSNFRKGVFYRIEIDDTPERILNDLEISFLEGKISKNIVRNDDTIAGYLAGAFLASGSVNSPETSNYHLEISLNSDNYAKWLSHLFARYRNNSIEPKITERRDKYILYFKKSQQIADFLIMIGAVSACMEFENTRISRDMANSTNRMLNSDAANMKKTIDTAERQIREIRYLDRMVGIAHMKNPKMKLLCELRLENESCSMNDLADMMSDQLGVTITKSNVNHLFRSLHEMYEKLAR